jgi:hypothetical protein
MENSNQALEAEQKELAMREALEDVKNIFLMVEQKITNHKGKTPFHITKTSQEIGESLNLDPQKIYHLLHFYFKAANKKIVNLKLGRGGGAYPIFEKNEDLSIKE